MKTLLRFRVLGFVAAGSFLLLNAAAFFHARSMTVYGSGDTTPKPEDLTLAQKAGVLLRGVSVARPLDTATPADFGLEFGVETIETPDGVTLEAWRIPARNPVATAVLFHGYADSKDSVLPAARVFHDLGCEVIAVDFRGCGGSSGNVTTLGVTESDDVSAVMRHVAAANPVRPLVIYGASMGGAALLRAAARDTLDADGLVLEGTFDSLRNAARNRFATLGVPAAGLAELLIFWGGVQHGFNGFDHAPRYYARGVTLPALVLNGSHDPRVTAEQARQLYEALAGWKRLVEFPAEEHVPLARIDADRFRSELGSFLERLRLSPRRSSP